MEQGERQSIEEAVKKQGAMMEAIRRASEEARLEREEKEAKRLQEEGSSSSPS